MSRVSDEVGPALVTVENERHRNTGSEKLPIHKIISIGCVEYVTKLLPESMRHDAHKCAMNQPSKVGETLSKAYTVLWLHFFAVQKYIDEVNLHIRYIQILGQIIFPNDPELQHRFKVHDCSKYSYEEVYGYVLRWTHGLTECPEWKVSLDHHLLTNDHHPEFFRGEAMSEAGLAESAVDMLSWRLIKNRADYPGKEVSEWLFDVGDKYLQRYMDADRVKVREMLNKWKSKGYEVNHL